jgi:hypothetical protein
MGIRLFGVDIAGEVKKATASGLPSVVLLRSIPGARGSDLSAGNNPSKRRYPCRGFREDFAASQFDGEIVKRGDHKILIIGDTLPSGVVPDVVDQIVSENATLTIVSVKRDPAAATYVCHVRGG